MSHNNSLVPIAEHYRICGYKSVFDSRIAEVGLKDVLESRSRQGLPVIIQFDLDDDPVVNKAVLNLSAALLK